MRAVVAAFLISSCSAIAQDLPVIVYGPHGPSPDCGALWERMEKTGGIKGVRFEKDPIGRIVPTVIIDDLLWEMFDYATRSAIARTFLCGFGKMRRNVLKEDLPDPVIMDFRSFRTNKVLGEWREGSLTVR